MKTKLNHNYNRTGLAVLLSNCNIDKCNQTLYHFRDRETDKEGVPNKGHNNFN